VSEAIREYLDRRAVAAASGWHASRTGEDAAAFEDFNTTRGSSGHNTSPRAVAAYNRAAVTAADQDAVCKPSVLPSIRTIAGHSRRII